MRTPFNASLPWLPQILNASALLSESPSPEDLFNSSSNPLPQFSGHFSYKENYTVLPVVRPSCIPPSIDEFPEDFFTDEQRLHGGILVHALIVAYVCAMLAIVCDRYFVPSLRVISSYFNVPQDIAGATFMAIGASSPELFSSVIGAFIAKGDIGIGTIVGSAVFNILAVTGASGLALGTMVLHLEWYPITRDCFVYILTVAALVLIIHDNIVTWLEASSLLLMFFAYLVLLYFNSSVQHAVKKFVKTMRSCWRRERQYHLHKIVVASKEEKSPLIVTTENGKEGYKSCDNSFTSSQNISSLTESTHSSSSNTTGDDNVNKIYVKNEKKVDFEESEEISLIRLPDSTCHKITWILMWPANFLFRITIPNCNTEKNIMWFPLTFLSSIMWLGVLSYISFWMVAIIGCTFGIPDTVSGITILAAGTSIPELVSSIIVVKSGMANMAISNLLGSNIFDILFCLGLPWLVKTLLNTETRTLVINSSALTYTTLILLSTVILFYCFLAFCRWRLGLKVGIMALCLYSVFLVLASLYESNFFGDFNPPVCGSS